MEATGIDLLQWRVPFNPEPPYAAPNHLGMAHATLMTADLASDYALLKKQGVEFLSAPYGAPGTALSSCATRWHLFEAGGEPDTQTCGGAGSNPDHGHAFIGINVSDVEASVSFYRRFGYESVRWINEQT